MEVADFGMRSRRRNATPRSERNCMSQQPLDIPKLPLVFAGHETRGATGHLHSSRAADAVHVIFRTIREIEIDHVADVGHIDTSGGNICCHQHTE